MKYQTGIERITDVMLRAATAKNYFKCEQKQLFNGRDQVFHSKISGEIPSIFYHR